MSSFDKKIFLSVAIAAASLAAAPRAMALEASYYAASSRLSQPGRWVKVKVTESGVHRISYEMLRQWGFENPEKVNVYGFPGTELYENIFSTTTPDDLPLQYCEHAADALLFYGEGDIRLRPRSNSETDLRRRRNHYSTYSCYFLSDADPGSARTAEVPFAEGSPMIDEHLSFDYQEPEEFQPENAGVFWFATPLGSTADKRVFTFSATDFTGQATVAWLPVSCSGSMITVEPELDADAMELQSRRGVTAIRPVTTDRTYLTYNSLPNPSNMQVLLHEGHSSFPVTFSGHQSADWIAIDYACLIYKRKNRLADHAQITLNLNSMTTSTNVRISEATEATRVWNVTYPASVMPLQTSFDAATSSVTVSPNVSDPVTLVAFNSDADNLPVPEFEGVVENPVDLHAEATDFDMLIITTASLMPAAQRLASLHEQRQGLSVKVIDHKLIFDEFSSGAPSAIAYRRYAKMLHDRNPGRLKYLLLLGHGTADHRFININDDGSYLFTYQVEEDRDLGYTDWSNYRVSNFSSDNYFGMLNDGFSIRNIPNQSVVLGVGRLPVAGLSQANEMIDKIETYLDTYLTEDHYSRMLALGDGGDQNAHLLMAENGVDIMNRLQPAVAADKIYHALFRTTDTDVKNISLWKSRLDESLAEGVSFMGFCGHAAATSFATGFTLSSISDMKFGNHPICVFATCGAFYVDQPTLNMGMEILRQPQGAVAVISAGRTVYLNRNKALYDAIIEGYYGTAPGDCLGDVWRKAFNSVVTKSDQSYGINSLCYNLGGDPALPVARPTDGAQVMTVNGAQASSQMRVSALQPLTLSGTITNTSGAVATDFSGNAVITLYDGAQTITTPDVNNGDKSVDVYVDSRVLARTGAEVVNGKWTATLTPPAGSVTGSTNRVLVWASDGAQRMALGDFKGISVADPSDISPSDDTTGPVISQMYLNAPSFVEGDAVGSDFTLHAVIDADPSGINVSNASIGQRLSVSLDYSNPTAMASNALRWQTDGSATLSYPFSNVSDGKHTLTIRLADNRGNVSERTIPFTVINNTLTGRLYVADNIITGRTTLNIDMPASASVTRVVIEDASHNTVETRKNISLPWSWTPDASLPDGHYTIRAFLKDGTRFGSTPPLSVTLIRNK